MKKKNKIRFMAMIFSLCICFTSVPVNAAENLHGNLEVQNELIPLEETEISREDAIAFLGLSDEDAAEASFYVMEVDEVESGMVSNLNPEYSTNQVSISPGVTYAFPVFTFSGYNVGQYWTSMGTRMVWGIYYISGASQSSIISVFLHGYGTENPNNVFDGVTDSVELLQPGHSYTSGIINVYSNYDYHFLYFGGNQSKVSVVVAMLQ